MEKLLQTKGIDGFLISNIFNVRYLSGYTGDDSFLLLTADDKYFITDTRYTEQAQEECIGFKVVDWKKKYLSLSSAIARIADEKEVKILGFEGSISHKFYCEIDGKLTCKLLIVKDVVEDLRQIKSLNEIEYSRKACEISDRAFYRILNDIKVGVTERELSAKLAYYLRIEGSDARYYENMMLSGARTSLLHGIPSEKKVENGDLVLMDFGAGYKGYLSDMSRTVVVGKANKRQKEVYEIVKKSEQEAINLMRNGINTHDVYLASIKHMKDTEYYGYHYTGIGHGVGLAVHEKPFMGLNSKDLLVKNNVITIEPGIYIPGWGGVRIEDQILVTDDGCEVMTKSPRKLIEL